MAVRRRRKGQEETVINISSVSPDMLESIEMHMRSVDREESSRSRFLQRHLQAREVSPTLSDTVRSAVQDMAIEDG